MSFNARPDVAMTARTIVIIAPPRVTLQDLTGPWEVFSRAAAYAPGAYRVWVASTGPELEVATKFGLGVRAHSSIFDLEAPLDTVLVAGSEQAVAGEVDPGFMDWLGQASSAARRVGSVCTGAFHLAQAGLLSGRRATTHWRYLQQLAEQYPDVSVDPDPIYVRDGEVYTSAGVTAGIDLSLAMVEADLGPDLAQTIARDLVVFLQRQADQAQLSAVLAQRMADRDPIRRLQAWAPDHLDRIGTVEDMAAFVNMSPRNFARLFKRETGETPGRYVQRLKVEAARRRLRETSIGLDRVAAQVGFGSARSMGRSLGKTLRTTPAAYRKTPVLKP